MSSAYSSDRSNSPSPYNSEADQTFNEIVFSDSIVPAATSTPLSEKGENLASDDESTDNLTTSMANADFFGEKQRPRPAYCIFVANLVAHLSDTELYYTIEQLFSKWGSTLSIKVLRDSSNRPYGFVQYTNKSDFQHALANANGAMVGNRAIRCEPARVNRTVLVNSVILTPSEMREHAESFGEIENITFGGKQGYYIRYAFREDATRAYTNFQQDSRIQAIWVQNLSECSDIDDYVDWIYVGQLGPDVTEEDLTGYYSKYGKVEEVSIIRKGYKSYSTGAPMRCHAFIKLDSADACAMAIENTNHTMFKGHLIHVQGRTNKASHFAPKYAPAPAPVSAAAHSSMELDSRMGMQQHSGYTPPNIRKNYKRPQFTEKRNFNRENTWNRTDLQDGVPRYRVGGKKEDGRLRSEHSRANPVKENPHPRRSKQYYPMYYYQVPWYPQQQGYM